MNMKFYGEAKMTVYIDKDKFIKFNSFGIYETENKKEIEVLKKSYNYDEVIEKKEEKEVETKENKKESKSKKFNKK